MKTQREMERFLDAQGIAYTHPVYNGVEKMRMLDTTQLPQSLREQFDERGFFTAPTDKNTVKVTEGKK